MITKLLSDQVADQPAATFEVQIHYQDIVAVSSKYEGKSALFCTFF